MSVNRAPDFGATVYKTVHPMLSDRCPVCQSVCPVWRWCIVTKRGWMHGSRCHALVRRQASVQATLC